MKIFCLLLISTLFLAGNIIGQNVADQISQNQHQIDILNNEIAQLQSQNDSLKLLRDIDDVRTIALPAYSSDAVIVEHSALILAYNEQTEQADWVAHKISVDIMGEGYGRTNDFRSDPKIKTGTAEKADYWYSGYDRGHLAPSADFRWSLKALSESYYYSNMSPQLPEFNREIWANLENVLRRYVEIKQRPLLVVTGPYFTDISKTIGDNQVAVPQYYYKAVLDYSGDTLSTMGFLLPHQKCEYPVFSYAISIDSLEQYTGIDFFSSLPDSTESELERRNDVEKWIFAAGNESFLPIDRNKLPKNAVNTVQARSYYDKKTTVCGTVASVHKSEKGHIFLNFDGQFPDQLFWCTIWKSDIKNFSYDPEKVLLNKKICVSGVVKEKYGKPSMSLSNEKSVSIYEDALDKP